MRYDGTLTGTTQQQNKKGARPFILPGIHINQAKQKENRGSGINRSPCFS